MMYEVLTLVLGTFDSNFASFCSNSNVNPDSIDLKLAKQKAEISSLHKDAEEWRERDNHKIITFPSYMPCSQETVDTWIDTYSPFLSVTSIAEYIDLHDDPHIKLLLADFYQFLRSIDVDPEDLTLTSSKPIQSLVCLGTGNGQFLASLINEFQPYNLVIIITRWEDFVSSFWCVDWSQISNFFSRQYRNIRVVRVQPDRIEVLSNAAINGIMAMEGTYLFTPSSTDRDLFELKDCLYGREAHNLLLYQGYTVDEYNMIYNTARFFLKRPKIYTRPILNVCSNVAVIGSGPSLDYSLEHLAELAKTHVIVCGGSNYRVLLSYGIEPDFLTLVERADGVYDTYKEIYDEFGPTKTKLVISSTCNDQLAELFSEVCLFYRPALTPAVLFAESTQQIISHEGPQAVCAAFSFALNLKPNNVVLVGVDLGSADIDIPRTKKAIGYSPRSLEFEVDGNLQDVVFTDRMLLDCRDVLAARIQTLNDSSESCSIFNVSNGVSIDGATSASLIGYCARSIDEPLKDVSLIQAWWSSLSIATPERMSAIMQLRKPRSGTLELIDELKGFLNDPTIPWMPSLVSLVENKLSLTDIPSSAQVPRRLIKSTIFKAVNTTTQYLLRLNKDDSSRAKQTIWGDFAKSRILQLLEQLEREVYLLFDAVDSLLEENK